MLSVRRVWGTPRRDSSQAVSRAPCRRGRVSSTYTWRTRPASKPRRMTPRAVPMPAVARPPELQWVNTASPGWNSPRPRWAMASHRATSWSKIASAAASRSPAPPPASRTAIMRSMAHMRLTAVGRASLSRAAARRRSATGAPDWARQARARAAATPMRGAPRTARRRMSWTMTSGSPASTHASRSGSRVWSRIRKVRPSWRKARDSMGRTGTSRLALSPGPGRTGRRRGNRLIHAILKGSKPSIRPSRDGPWRSFRS